MVLFKIRIFLKPGFCRHMKTAVSESFKLARLRTPKAITPTNRMQLKSVIPAEGGGVGGWLHGTGDGQASKEQPSCCKVTRRHATHRQKGAVRRTRANRNPKPSSIAKRPTR